MARRLKVGEALERWIEGDGEELTGRVTFQLEKVYAVKNGRRYGPYGPYWYMYYYVGRGQLHPSTHSRRVSKYVGKPENIDPRTMTPQELGRLIKQPIAHRERRRR
jgi:hypothetical protein